MKTKFALLGLVVVVGGALGLRVLSRGGFASSSARAEEQGEGWVRIYGNIEVRDVQLVFNGSEHLAEVRVEEGDRVATGDELARLVTDRLDARVREAESRRDAQREVLRQLENGARPEEVDQARAELAAAEAREASARRDVERLEATSTSGATSRQALEDAQARLQVEVAGTGVRRAALELVLQGPRAEEVAQARARLAELEAGLERLRIERADAVLTAPAAGVVQSRVLEPGEFATPERPVLTLALTGEKWVRAYVSEPDLGRIQEGREAEVTSDSFPGERFPGRVGFLSSVAEFTPKFVQTTDLRPQLVYEVRVYVEDAEDHLRLGQPVSVDVGPRLSERR